MYSGVPATMPALGQAGVVGGPGQPEVGDLDPLDAVLQQDVRRLDVPVDQPLGVGGGQPARPPACRSAGTLGRRQRPGPVEPVLEGLAGDELHDQVRQRLLLLDRVDGDDVLVADRGRGPGLADEPLAGGGAGRQLRGQHLDRDDPLRASRRTP